ncbi:cupin domain-containing protein [Craterilacuibacter sp.]|uniref:cupin domain-containing protein n=1 Tax=Craterilacuibacter sp. TaxID=2870909 RepID=UPI003F3ABFDA
MAEDGNAGNLRQGRLGGHIPASLPVELTETLAASPTVRIERIVSRGHASPPDFWYQQDEDEFVLLFSGQAILEIEGQGQLPLAAGDWVHLPAGLRHRVHCTAADTDTLWLAVFSPPATAG